MLTYHGYGWVESPLVIKGVSDINFGKRFVGVGIVGRAFNSRPLSDQSLPAHDAVQDAGVVLNERKCV